MGAWKEIGCTICGYVSKTEREATAHFDKTHKNDPNARECSVWVNYFKEIGAKNRQEAAYECLR